LEYEKKRRIADKICRKKKGEALNEHMIKINEEFQIQNIHMAFNEIKSHREGFKPKTDMCKDRDGTIIEDKEGIKVRWVEYFQELLNGNTEEVDEGTEELPDKSEADSGEQVDTPTLEEVRDSLKALRNNTAPGGDNLQGELLKYGRDGVAAAIHSLITSIWEREYVPEEWQRSVICPIYKKGDKLECMNYRGIALLCTALPYYAIGFKPMAEGLMGEYQAGFRSGRSTMDQLFTVKLFRNAGLNKV
jgi:hypothetical protein